MNPPNYVNTDNELIIGDTIIKFDFPIDMCAEIQGMVIVLLSIPPKVEYTENVFGVSISEKKIVWQIKKRSFKQGPYTHLKCSYNGLSVYNNRLRLNNWCSVYLIVDPESGDVLEEGETR